MARPIWTGAITFGLVSVPVAMYSATHDHEVSFHQFERGTSDRIRYKRVNERTGKEVDFDDIVKGAEVGGGRYVMIEPDELDAVAPGRSRSLEIHRFVALDEIDPVHYQKTYYLGPGRSAGYAVANLGLEFRPSASLKVFAQVRNLFDRRYDTAAQLGATAFDAQGNFVARPFAPNAEGDRPLVHSTFLAPGAPRTFWVGVRWQFDD